MNLSPRIRLSILAALSLLLSACSFSEVPKQGTQRQLPLASIDLALTQPPSPKVKRRGLAGRFQASKKVPFLSILVMSPCQIREA